MNSEITIYFLLISLLGMFIFWLLYRKANNTNAQAQKYLIASLQDTTLTPEVRATKEKQLSNLLQKNSTDGNSKIIAVLSLVLILSSFILYHKLGTPNAIEQLARINHKQQPPTQSQAPQLSMQDAIIQLEAKLTENPNDIDAQILYARSQISMKNYDKAVSAYRKSNELAPNQAVILTELAEAIALANNNRSFLGEPESLLALAVNLEPENQKALWLYGMTFYEQENFTKANQIWTKLYGLMSNESAKTQLAQQLQDVRNKLGIESEINQPKGPIQKSNSDINTLVTLTINLDDSLVDKLQGKRALLYIYTKETTGMPMPIAVIRKPLEEINKSFPITVSFTDNNNLQPNRKLSSFDSVKIGARISFTGNATPQAGDLQSPEVIINLSNKDTIELVIDKIR